MPDEAALAPAPCCRACDAVDAARDAGWAGEATRDALSQTDTAQPACARCGALAEELADHADLRAVVEVFRDQPERATAVGAWLSTAAIDLLERLAAAAVDPLDVRVEAGALPSKTAQRWLSQSASTQLPSWTLRTAVLACGGAGARHVGCRWLTVELLDAALAIPPLQRASAGTIAGAVAAGQPGPGVDADAAVALLDLLDPADRRWADPSWLHRAVGDAYETDAAALWPTWRGRAADLRATLAALPAAA